MADSQMEEMRKAYAGIMLNMAQESAARVLAAERRAAALAAGLEAAKDDGVAALLRLKAIMDARVKEVALESSAHVERIKELEEQLHGAQNTMASLKVELHLANNELERTRKTLAVARINSLPTSKEADSNKDTGPHSEIHQQGQGGNILLKNKKNTDDCDEACLVPIVADNGAVEKLDINRCSPDLPSFMERNKKPKFYHNGCTQRIHALKQRTKGTGASLKQNPKQATTLNSCSKTRKNNAAKNPCHTRSIMEEILQTKFLGKYKGKRGRRSRPSCKHDNSSEHGEAEDKLSDTSGGNGCLLLIQALEQELSPPKISAGQGVDALTDMKEDLKISRRDAGLNQGTAFPELLDVLAVNNMQVKKRKRTKTIRVMEDELSDSKSVPGSANTLLRTISEKSVSDYELISEMAENHSDTSAKNNGPPPKCTTENFIYQTGVDNGQFEPENSSAVLLQSTKSEPIDHGNLVVDQLEQITPNTDTASCKEVLEDGSCSSASQKADASTVSSLDKEENLKASSGLPVQALEKPDASIAISLNKEEDAKTASGASMQAEGARHIKYTFNRRKRKCVSIYSTPQRAVPEKNSDLSSPPRKQNRHPNPVMQEHPVGSPKRDNHLVHIAQQLILLSGNK